MGIKEERFERKLAERRRMQATLSPAEYKRWKKQLIKARKKNRNK